MLTALTVDQQTALLMQGTTYGDEDTKRAMAAELRERLLESQRTGRPLRVYCGYDPRKPDLHLGHTITMRKLRQFQDLGHHVIFLIGSYTSLVGDPSDKDQTRPVMTPEEVEANARTYIEQAFKILDPQRTEVRHNGEWLSQLRLADLIRIAQNFTVQQFLARENFAKRLERGEPIFLQETFYALMQAYDAVALQADVQVGGTDQLFNILIAGRKLQQAMGQRPQVAIILDILPGTDGEVKMSKSLGNHIPILAEPADMYGKVMSIPDHAMPIYFKLVTRYTPEQVAAIEQGLADGSRHPRDVKMELAREIVSIFHGDEAAAQAEEHFRTVFQQRELPSEMPEVRLMARTGLLSLMKEHGLAPSTSEARRLVQQGGVRLDGHVVTDPQIEIEPPAEPVVLQVGKRKFLRIVGQRG
ncbi:MAG: tyrosine--tRNA ligase [Caldilineales bacterium]|nr:tyrosine--tRNA ligase [Caldilineales bacterium]MDW8318640.1 tyrosine--tRNA ligase [Anaerolineae bacterium]